MRIITEAIFLLNIKNISTIETCGCGRGLILHPLASTPSRIFIFDTFVFQRYSDDSIIHVIH